ncbi:hypothetical protein C0Q70_06933 [Pomacea canaliculata]|uniref:sarcosine oxidasee (formaldehyde-forming) n=1 Tax=Pomacea canaliculata TaxID=400727 RepID=A0A2T7PDN2_POMCA|nr:peroxisomal sarcosine oxidase-like [Pomacea canaliculata]PVD31520.1 hypothetical protein C0Q70_06933 [Pomacea canaliculata]
MSAAQNQFDVIVIGAGVEGSSSAYSLAKGGQRTLLLEQFPLPHSRGSSHGQSRITRYSYDQPFYTHMMLDAYPLWSTLENEAGVSLYKQCGTLILSEPGSEVLRAVESSLRQHSVPFQTLSPEELQTRYPMMSYSKSRAAILDPKGGILRAERAVAAYQSVFKRNGGVVRDSEKVICITPGASQVSVQTTRGTYLGRSVVIAAGPWADQLLRPLGLELPLRPKRVAVLYWQETEKGIYSSDTFPCMIDEAVSPNFYALPSEEYPGYVKVALHTGPDTDPDKRDQVGDTWVRETVAAYIRKHLPKLSDMPGILETCMYTNTPDDNPIIDRHPKWKNIIVAAGFSGHGFKLAPAVGKAVRELVTGSPSSYNMMPFRINRFGSTSKL